MIRIHHDTTASGMKWPHALEINDLDGDRVEITIDDEPSHQAFSIDLDQAEVRRVVEALNAWITEDQQ